MSAPNPFDQQKPIEGVKKIVAISSGKGGVGKSTVSSNLAVALTQAGKRIGLLDADIYGPSQPRMMGALNQKPPIGANNKIDPIQRHGVNLMSMGLLVEEDMAVAWRGPMLFKAMNQLFYDVNWGELDFLLIDLPPGTGDVQLSMVQKVPVDAAITVCTPQNIALADVKKSLDMFERVNVKNLGVVENMAHFIEPKTGEKIQIFPKGDLKAFLDSKQIPHICEIPINSEMALASEMGLPYTAQKNVDDPISLAYQTMAQKVIAQV